MQGDGFNSCIIRLNVYYVGKLFFYFIYEMDGFFIGVIFRLLFNLSNLNMDYKNGEYYLFFYIIYNYSVVLGVFNSFFYVLYF